MNATLESEGALIARLQAGDESAFVSLVDMYAGTLMHIARRYVKDQASAEEVVQETWLAVLSGLSAFGARCSLKSWICAILIKRAMTRGKRDARQIPFSSLAHGEIERYDPAVAANRFEGPGGEWPRHWRDDAMPAALGPDTITLNREMWEYLANAIQNLPQAQRAVVEMRDISGADLADIATALELSDGNVRVLLHRGRSKLRTALECYFMENSG